MSKKKGGTYTKVMQTKGYTRYKGTPREQKVSGGKRATGYGYDRESLTKMHLARPIIDRAIDERIKANLISEHRWVVSHGNAGDLEGIDDRITSTHDLTPEQKIQVLNGILKRLGIKADVVIGTIAEPIEKWNRDEYFFFDEKGNELAMTMGITNLYKDITSKKQVDEIKDYLEEIHGKKVKVIEAESVHEAYEKAKDLSKKSPPVVSMAQPIKKAVPYALLPRKEQEQIKEEVKKEAIKAIKKEKPKTVSKSELDQMLEGLETL